MPSDSVLQAIVEYAGSKTVAGDTLPIRAFRDSATAEVGGTPVLPPYVVVRSEGGRATRDFEGNDFGPANFSLTVYAKTAAECRAIFDTVMFNAQAPKLQAGIEAYNALMPYLTGHSSAQVYIDGQEREGRGTRRGPDLTHTLYIRFQVNDTRS